MMEIIWLIAGALLGGGLGWFFGLYKTKGQEGLSKQEAESLNSHLISCQTRLNVALELNAGLQKNVESYKQELLGERNHIIDLSTTLSRTETDLKNLQEKLASQKEEVEKLQEKFAHEFKNLANEIFEDKSRKFTDQNKSNMTELLNPLKERIVDFEKKVVETNKESLAWNAALREQISGLKELNIQITKEAENLTKALKGESKTQGNWGEIILESVLEKSGLQKNREYFVQESFTTEEGRRLQPDVIIHLPDDKKIIIDSKVSLVAYEKYCSSAEEGERLSCIKNHVTSIRGHIKNLAEKKYHHLYEIKGLDFVLLFVPIEPAFGLAVQNENGLFNEAFEKNIVIVSPTTLLATLRTIASIWRQEYQNRNAMEIAKQGGDLYDKFRGFVEDLITLGKNLQTTQNSYQDAMNKLVEGKGNLVSRVEKLRKLGAGVTKSLPQSILDRAEED